MTTGEGPIIAFIWEPRGGGKLYLDPREVTIVRAPIPSAELEASLDVIADLADATGAEIALDDVLFNRMDRAIAHGRRDVMRAFIEERERRQSGRYTTEGMYYVVLGNERTRMNVKEYMDEYGERRQG